MTPDVSLIIASYHDAEHLGARLDGVFASVNQGYPSPALPAPAPASPGAVR